MRRLLILLSLAALPGMALALMPHWNGDHIVDPSGMTLYTFDQDGPDFPNCTGACSNQWPPALASANDVGVGDFAITVNPDGQRQWSYRGHPLYRFSGDAQPGQANGDGLGGRWNQVSPFWP
jgi:predicted lipoprotein with Yx(FWY)xxD motif